jgi:hypothetical protein
MFSILYVSESNSRPQNKNEIELNLGDKSREVYPQ